MKLHHLVAVLSLLLRLHGAELSFIELQTVHYTLITANSPDCNSSLNNDYPVAVLGFNFTGIEQWTKVEPQIVHAESECDSSSRSTRMPGQSEHIRPRCYKLDIPKSKNSSCVQLRFVQAEHRGGFCDCWAIVGLRGEGIKFNVQVKSGYQSNLTDFQRLDTSIAGYGINNTGLCRGSASIPRELMFNIQVNRSFQTRLNRGGQTTLCTNKELGDKSPAFDTAKIQGNYCDIQSHDSVVVNFDLQLGHQDPLDRFDEGVELAFRLCNLTECNGDWIPIKYYAHDTVDRANRNDLIMIGKETSPGKLLLRGYSVSYEVDDVHRIELTLCDKGTAQSDSIQFRWLQTVRLTNETADGVNLDNVKIVFNSTTERREIVLLDDNFNNQTAINRTKWTTVRRVSLKNASVQFGGPTLRFTPLGTGFTSTIVSREMTTAKLLIPEPTVTTQPITPTTFAPPSEVEKIEEEVLNNIIKDGRLSSVYNLIEQGDCPTCVGTALHQLNDVVESSVAGRKNSSSKEVDLVAVSYLLSRINSNLKNGTTVNQEISKVFLSVADSVTVASRANKDSQAEDAQDAALAGSTLLKVLDSFALNSHNASQPVSSDNIVLQVLEKEADNASIEQKFEGSGADISIPGEVVGAGRQQIRMASFLFKNPSGLLPESLGGTDNDSNVTDNLRLASPIISATFLCDGNCTTSNLSTPVNVTFKLSSRDQELLENDPDGAVKCVFWQFDETYRERPSAVLFPGQWSQEGCKTEIKSGKAVCSCNHLTHFAILLSDRPLNLSRQHTLALETIGYIGVSVSLIAMAMTIMVFIFLNRSMRRPLQKIRNYIHIQLCVTLGIAQIIFVAGIKPDYDAGHLVGGVPLGCRLVAVLLHYWFLVSFMWMLMEGVVLYVALVLVFVKHHFRYMAAFTIISYGLPLLYVGGLTVPLGFARSDEMRKNHTYDYGYEEACYLNPKTSFIWSLIAPVLVIFVANIGFFIMAIVIMFKHQKRQTTKSRAKSVKQWLKACVSLSLVMGITWIIGVLVIEVEELFALAYVFTIFVAFQGLFIFITFVLISESKRVKELYRKWWKGKVAESDFLSKHFGEKTLTSTLNSHHYVGEMSSVQCDKGHVVDMEEDSSNHGTYFDITFVPAFMSSSNSESTTGDEGGLTQEGFLEDFDERKQQLSGDNKECSFPMPSQPMEVLPLNSLVVDGQTSPTNTDL